MTFSSLKRALACLISATCLASLLPIQVNAWGRNGHRIVARIAANHLSLKTRNAIAALMAADTNDTGNCKTQPTFEDRFACISTFADEVRDEKKFPQFADTRPLHFVNVPIFAPKSKRRYIASLYCKKGCVVSGVSRYTTALKTSNDDAEKAVALKFIVHFIGDLHQPLHTVADRDQDFGDPANYTNGHVQLITDPNNDQGGNLKYITWFGANPSMFGCNKLHGVWDDLIISKKGLTDKLYTTALDTLSAADVAARQKGSVVDWVNEAVTLAVNHSYGDLPQRDMSDKVCEVEKEVDGQKRSQCEAFTPEPCKQTEVHSRYHLADEYFQDNQPVVESQLQNAGLRLARYLNNIFDPA